MTSLLTQISNSALQNLQDNTVLQEIRNLEKQISDIENQIAKMKQEYEKTKIIDYKIELQWLEFALENLNQQLLNSKF